MLENSTGMNQFLSAGFLTEAKYAAEVSDSVNCATQYVAVFGVLHFLFSVVLGNMSQFEATTCVQKLSFIKSAGKFTPLFDNNFQKIKISLKSTYLLISEA